MKKLALTAIATAALASALTAAPANAATPRFHNCTAMHHRFHHGVGIRGARDHVSSGQPVTNFYRNRAIYLANKGLDRDHDHIACEAH